ncbi:hypothetical protein KEM56_004874, partial [Ascosphaera pollenicola]
RTAAAASVTPYAVANPFDRRERTESERAQRRSRSRSPQSRSRSIEPPSGPRNPNKPSRGNFHHGRHFRPPFKHNNNSNGGNSGLPEGWFTALSEDGRTYYYSETGLTQWHRPTASGKKDAAKPKPKSANDNLQAIIDRITTEKSTSLTTKSATPTTPADMLTGQIQSDKKEKKEKWRQYSEEKQMKIYENTLFPHVKHVVDKFKHKLPKEELKRLAKELSKKLVNSDYKAKRVEDPTKISEKQAQKVKKYCKEFFDKAVVKHRAYEERRVKRKSSQQPSEGQSAGTAAITNGQTKEDDGDHVMSAGGNLDRAVTENIDRASSSPLANGGAEPVSDGDAMRKRKRDSEESSGADIEDDNTALNKKQRSSPKLDNAPPSSPRQALSSAQPTSTPVAEDRDMRDVAEETTFIVKGDGANGTTHATAQFSIELESEHSSSGDFAALREEYMIDQIDDKSMQFHDRPMHGTN